MNPAIDQIFHAFTMFDNYYMSYNEIMMIVELIEVEKIKIDIDGSKVIEVDKKEFV